MKELQKIEINARPPVNYLPNAELELINITLKYFEKQDYKFVSEECGKKIQSILKNLPTPSITDADIFEIFYGAVAYKKIGEDLKFKASLKVLYSLSNSVDLLSDRGIELLKRGIAMYVELAEKEGIDELNSIDVLKIKFTKSGCFIATAVYGTEQAHEIVALKDFRDGVLMKKVAGRAFVKMYYRVSPPIANFIAKSHSLRRLTKFILIEPLLRITQIINQKDN